jgi:hypothetical protein
MKIVSLGIAALIAFAPIGTDVRVNLAQKVQNPAVRAQYALSTYIHPQVVSALTEEQGTATSSYRWRGVYSVDRNDPQIVAVLKTVNHPYYSPGMADVTLYERQLEAAGYKLHSRMGGIFSYNIKDEKGKTWAVIVRGDNDFHPANSTEFSVFISVPGG